MAPECNKYASWRTFNGAPADLIFVISRDGTGVAVPTQAYSVRYSARRRYPAVVVYPDLRVEVVAPPGTPLTAIEDLYRRKSAWVARTLERFRAEPCPVTEREYVPGERFLFAGRERVLVLEEGDGYAARFDGEALRVPVTAGAAADEVRERVIELYRQAAIEAIGPMLELHAARMGLAPPPFRVKHLRRRWGSCSRAGRLNFNLRLAMAPPGELEYIVVHEPLPPRPPRPLARLLAHGRAVHARLRRPPGRAERGLLAVRALIRAPRHRQTLRGPQREAVGIIYSFYNPGSSNSTGASWGATISIAAGPTARTGRLERMHRLLGPAGGPRRLHRYRLGERSRSPRSDSDRSTTDRLRSSRPHRSPTTDADTDQSRRRRRRHLRRLVPRPRRHRSSRPRPRRSSRRPRPHRSPPTIPPTTIPPRSRPRSHHDPHHDPDHDPHHERADLPAVPDPVPDRVAAGSTRSRSRGAWVRARRARRSPGSTGTGATA